MCTGACGCYFIDLLNKTQVGTVAAPATKFTFRVCILCDFGFSYLGICAGDNSLPITIGGGELCNYQLTSDNNDPCPKLKVKPFLICVACWFVRFFTFVMQWASPSGCSTAFKNGACDVLSVTVYGVTTNYQFSFQGHAGRVRFDDAITHTRTHAHIGDLTFSPSFLST